MHQLVKAKLKIDLVKRSLIEQDEADPGNDNSIKPKLDLIMEICTATNTILPSNPSKTRKGRDALAFASLAMTN
jgi:hypothetical protein